MNIWDAVFLSRLVFRRNTGTTESAEVTASGLLRVAVAFLAIGLVVTALDANVRHAPMTFASSR